MKLFEKIKKWYKKQDETYKQRMENCSYPQRWSRGRETNPEYKG